MPDMLLAILLLLFVPARALYRSLRPVTPARSLATRYLATIRDIAVLLAVLVLMWVVEGRDLAALGLAAPTSAPALVGLAIAVAILGGLAFMVLRVRGNATAAQAAGTLVPDTRHGLPIFLLFSAAVGFGWEVLYRGFLLWWLPPLTGWPIAILLSAGAYGAAHGYKNRNQFIGSIAAALAFAIAYWLSGSLWWLILLHTGLPLIGLLARSDRR